MSVLQRAPAEDPLEDLLERLKPALLGVLGRFRIPFQDGEDLLQQACLLYLEKRAIVRSPETWMVAALQRLCMAYWRTRRRRLYDAVDKGVLELVELPSATPQEAEEVRHDLRRVLSRISGRCRSLLLLRYHLGCDAPEAAGRLGYSTASIGALTTRCVAAMTRQLICLGLVQESPHG